MRLGSLNAPRVGNSQRLLIHNRRPVSGSSFGVTCFGSVSEAPLMPRRVWGNCFLPASSTQWGFRFSFLDNSTYPGFLEGCRVLILCVVSRRTWVAQNRPVVLTMRASWVLEPRTPAKLGAENASKDHKKTCCWQHLLCMTSMQADLPAFLLQRLCTYFQHFGGSYASTGHH